jgi:hypothetical protein
MVQQRRVRSIIIHHIFQQQQHTHTHTNTTTYQNQHNSNTTQHNTTENINTAHQRKSADVSTVMGAVCVYYPAIPRGLQLSLATATRDHHHGPHAAYLHHE